MSLPPNRFAVRPNAATVAPAHTRPEMGNKVEIISPSQYTDRRAEPRVLCDDRGALLLGTKLSVVTCRILDQSASGARVAFDGIGDIPSELWLVDLGQNTVKRGSSAWSTVNRMGLKFNFMQALVPGAPRPTRVPENVYAAWLKLAGYAPDEKPEDDGDDEVLYFD